MGPSACGKGTMALIAIAFIAVMIYYIFFTGPGFIRTFGLVLTLGVPLGLATLGAWGLLVAILALLVVGLLYWQPWKPQN